MTLTKSGGGSVDINFPKMTNAPQYRVTYNELSPISGNYITFELPIDNISTPASGAQGHYDSTINSMVPYFETNSPNYVSPSGSLYFEGYYANEYLRYSGYTGYYPQNTASIESLSFSGNGRYTSFDVDMNEYTSLINSNILHITTNANPFRCLSFSERQTDGWEGISSISPYLISYSSFEGTVNNIYFDVGYMSRDVQSMGHALPFSAKIENGQIAELTYQGPTTIHCYDSNPIYRDYINIDTENSRYRILFAYSADMEFIPS